MLGRFHEISIETPDIRASVEFYERLGFTHAPTGDTWTHPYGVLTDGRIFIGLHQRRAPSPTLTFVRPGIAQHLSEFAARGIELDRVRTGDEVFNEIAFRDPNGQHISILEARTYSPVTRSASETSLCGYFTEYSIPTADFEATKLFWEPLGFVATGDSESLTLTSDHLNLAFHRPRTFNTPMLIFSDPNLTKLSGMNPIPMGANTLLRAPEGTSLLLLQHIDAVEGAAR